MPKDEIVITATWPRATAARASEDRRPTTMVSTTPKSIIPTWTTTTGTARRTISSRSARRGFSNGRVIVSPARGG